MKIGILTITPNIGFGGILQAYALKTVLDQLGNCQSEVINFRVHYSFRNKCSFFFHSLISLLNGNYAKLTYKSTYNYMSKNVRPFQDKYLNFSTKVTSEKELRQLINKNYDLVVVGSDQVWRPKYVHGIDNYFFNGISGRIKKMSYAASFGVDSWEFSDEETKTCSNLLKEFEYVSVREQSGLTLVKNYLEYDHEAYWDLDPTLLIGKSAFDKLLYKPENFHNFIFTYILDDKKSKTNFIEIVSSVLKKKVYHFNTNAENPKKPLKERVAPKVEDWLSGIYYSDFVVTDSFHACVFSILFNKPFIVYVNKDRGSERFISILRLLKLTDRMIFNIGDFSQKTLYQNIHWDIVNSILESKRNEIIGRLSIIVKNKI